jgi:AraC-like DNA-binding protein
MSPKLRHLLGTIFRQSEERAEGWDLIVRGQELTFFGLLRQSGAIVAADSRATKSKFGLSVLDILGSAYQENITFKDVAQLMSYSHSYFCRKFRDTFSMSFQQYLSQYRLSKARMFLAQGGMTVGQVAEQVGYRSVNFFSRSFRELYGCTPGQFQKEHFRTPTVAEAAGERERQGP